MDTDSKTAAPLYQSLLGGDWTRLADAVQRLHGLPLPVVAGGAFRVRHGSNVLTRLLARLAQLPPAGDGVPVDLCIVPRRSSEEWRRAFGGRPFTTAQFARHDGLLAERRGCVEMFFQLQVVGGALMYQSTGAALCLGPLRVGLPRWLSPRVAAVEKPAGAGHAIAVAVDVQLPMLGRLIAYDGTLTVVEAAR